MASLEEKLLGGGGGDDLEDGGGDARRLDDLRSTVKELASFCRQQISATSARRQQWRLETPKPSREEEEESHDGSQKWRKKLGEILESTTTQAILLSLLLLDLLATIVDILHTLHNNSLDLSTCISLLQSCSSSSSFSLSSDWEALSYFGIFVLFVLLLNLLGLLVALGPLPFFSHPGYFLDAVVVIVALVLELFLDTDTISLLVILNLWRIIRVAHGVFEFTDSAWEKNVEKLEAQMESVERMRERDLQTIRNLQARIRQLES